MTYTKVKALKRQMKSLIKYQPSLIFLCIIYTITITLFSITGIIMPRYIINAIVNEESLEQIITLIGIMGVTLIISGGISTYINVSIFYKLFSLRMIEFNNFIRYHLSAKFRYTEDPTWQDITDKSSNTLSNDSTGYQGTFETLFKMFATILSSVVFMYIIAIFNYYLLIAILFSTLVTIITGKLSKDYILKKDEELRHSRRKIKYFSNITGDFSYAKDIKVYSLKDRLLEYFKNENRVYVRILKNMRRRRFFLSIIDFLFVLLSQGVIYYFLINSVVNAEITIGDFSMYIATTLILSTTLIKLSKDIFNIYEWLGYTVIFYNYITNEEYNLKEGGVTPNFDDTLEIEFVNVSFKYPNSEEFVLKDFNFKIEKKTKLAIVGANGAGKSTIIKLITGLYDVTSGDILINGISINQYDRKKLYQQFSVVFQEINIFAFSVLENVSMKTVEKTDVNLVKECIKSVGLEEKIESLPDKFNTSMLKIIDEKGVEFSGGENQKLAIARALYQKGKCVILDEPTAALDALAEAEIYENFSHLVEDKTAIYISHRIASTKFCDKIALFTKEGLKEYGNHKELMELKGLYYEMFITQGKYYQEGDVE